MPDSALSSGDGFVDPDLQEIPPPPPITWRPMLMVMVGGGIGTLARGELLGAVSLSARSINTHLVAINVSGAFVLGVVAMFFDTHHSAASRWRLLVTTGLLGGWTTYSSVVGSSVVATHSNHPVLAIAVGLCSIGLTLLGAWAGLLCGRRLFPALAP